MAGGDDRFVRIDARGAQTIRMAVHYVGDGLARCYM